MHPDAEHLIPQAHQLRQLPAFRLEDLSTEDVLALQPDFILEYFEGKEYVELERAYEDPNWVRFVRAQYGDMPQSPQVTVVLRTAAEFVNSRAMQAGPRLEETASPIGAQDAAAIRSMATTGGWPAVCMQLIAVVLGQALLGLALLGLLQGTHQRRLPAPWAETLGLSMALGIAGTAAILFVYSLAGGRLNGAASWTLTAVGVIAGTVCLTVRRRGGQVGRTAVASGIGERAVEPKSSPERALVRVSQVVVGVLLVSATVQTLLTPQRFWDERAIFGIKAKVLAEAQSVTAPLLRQPEFVQYHPRYPLLLPLIESHIYATAGIDDRWSKLPIPVLFSALVLGVAGILTRRCGPGRAWLTAAMLAGVPVLFPFELGVISAQGDAPTACFHGLAVLAIWDRLGQSPLRTSPRDWLLPAVLGAATAFTKDEGLAYLMIDWIAIVLIWPIGRWGRRCARHGANAGPVVDFSLRQLMLVLTVSVTSILALLMPWMWHRQSLPTTTEMEYVGNMSAEFFLSRPGDLAWVAEHLLRRMFGEWDVWGLQWWGVLLAGASACRCVLRPAQCFLLLDIAGALGAFLLAAMIAPAELHDHVSGSSQRYLMQIAPTAVIFIAGQWLCPARAPVTDTRMT
jgi:hypothetical protein